MTAPYALVVLTLGALPAAEIDVGLQWYSEDLRIEDPAAGRFLPAHSSFAVPVGLTVRPGTEAGPAWLERLYIEGRWLRTAPREVPEARIQAVHTSLRGEAGTLFELQPRLQLGPTLEVEWARTRLDAQPELVEPTTLRFGGGLRGIYGRTEGVWLQAQLTAAYLASVSGVGPNSDDGLALRAAVELSSRSAQAVLGAGFFFDLQRFGPDAAGGEWDRIGVCLRLGGTAQPKSSGPGPPRG